MLAGQRRPRNLPAVHTVHHGTSIHPAAVKRAGGIRSRGGAYREGKPVTRATFASHDKAHAASFAAPHRNTKGFVYSGKKTGTWHSEPYKKYVDSQYKRGSFKPKTVTQVSRGSKGQFHTGHTWNVSSGSLPKHTSIQSHRAGAFKHTTPHFKSSVAHHTH